MWCKTSLRAGLAKKETHCTLHPVYAAGATLAPKAGTGGGAMGGRGMMGPVSSGTSMFITGHDKFGTLDCTPVRRPLSVSGVCRRRLTVAAELLRPKQNAARIRRPKFTPDRMDGQIRH